MKVLICGSRTWTDEDFIEDVMSTLPEDTIIIHGEQRGADSIAKSVAKKLGFKVFGFPPEWYKYGKRAGTIRNYYMLAESRPDMVIAFFNDRTKNIGTSNMVRQAKVHGVDSIVEFTLNEG